MSRSLSALVAALCIWGCDDAPWWPGPGGGGGAGGGGECAEPNPQGCFSTGCPAGERCTIGDSCAPSSCECDGESGEWICTDDCGGGICVPGPDACADHQCRPWQECRIWEPTGEAYCADTCDGFECRDDQVCELQEVQCVRAPCPPVARCVPAADPCAVVLCGPGSECRVNDAGEPQCVPILNCENVLCEPGHVCEMQDGRPVCVPQCRGENPQGCRAEGCPRGQECQVGDACIPSRCECGPNGAWICTEDCGGGQCVPRLSCDNVDCLPGHICEMQDGRPVCVPICEGENPAGCRDGGCPDGQRCEVGDACIPSACRCDPDARQWVCTADCGGGECVPDRSPCDLVRCLPDHECVETDDGRAQCVPICEGPNPQGCRERGCPDGQRCEVEGTCAPSDCRCDRESRQWICTDDCGGGECVPELDCRNVRCLPGHVCEMQDGRPVCVPVCRGENPAGCRNTGCPAGQRCEVGDSCEPSSCECDFNSGQWICTDDCGGGQCVPELTCDNVLCAPGFRCEMQDGRPVCVPVLSCENVLCAPGHICRETREGPRCVPACEGPNPAGCRQNGCPDGQSCEFPAGVCVPSSCQCDVNSGQWACTRDCGGGVCMDDPCAGHECRDWQECRVHEGEPYCADTCDGFPCRDGQVCELQEVFCVREPCPPIARCVDPAPDPCADHACRDWQVCRVHDGEPYCADTCDGFPCERGTECRLTDVQCVREPCPPVAQCVPVNPCAGHECRPHQVCQVHEGEPYCADTCRNFPCEEGSHCELQDVVCVREPCPPIAQCVPDDPDPCANIECRAWQECRVHEGEPYCADTCEGYPCERGTHCELIEVQCVRAPCPPIAQCRPNDGLQWYLTCGDPVCRGHTPRDDIPRCREIEAGDPCRTPGLMCDPGNECNALLVCTDSDPRDRGCPISSAAKKQDIEYLDPSEVDALAAKVQAIKLAKWQYQANPEGQHFGFIIEDGVPQQALRVTGDQVDLYGYTSLAVATLQAQSRQMAAMQAQLDALQKQVEACQK